MASPELPYCTYRFRKIPTHFDVTTFEAIVPLEEHERVLFSSLSPDYDVSNTSFQIGTITWSTTPSRLRGLVPDDLTTLRFSTASNVPGDHTRSTAVQEIEVEIDSHFRGFTPLNADPAKEGQTVEYMQPAEHSTKSPY